MGTTNNKAVPLRGAASRTPRAHYKQSGSFNKAALPHPADYYAQHGLKLIGDGEWKAALCPFHNDSKPSLRIRLDTGGFRCMACGAHGGDVLAFHQQRYGMGFIEAAKQLGAWRVA